MNYQIFLLYIVHYQILYPNNQVLNEFSLNDYYTKILLDDMYAKLKPKFKPIYSVYTQVYGEFG